MKLFLNIGDNQYKPISSISTISKVKGYPNMYDITFNDGTIKRFSDLDRYFEDKFI